MKIYTKTGDTGLTSFLSGNRAPKNHIRIEAYGSVDELNSFIGLLRSQDLDENSKETLFYIQNKLFSIGSNLASDENKKGIELPKITDDDIQILEQEMDKMEEELTPLKNFIIPGGHQAVGISHICRSVCRRAERRCVELSLESTVDLEILKFLNRLSDYFFMLSRFLCLYYKVEENYWINKKL
jgi:cob(I)alamin adenosyltransferase